MVSSILYFVSRLSIEEQSDVIMDEYHTGWAARAAQELDEQILSSGIEPVRFKFTVGGIAHICFKQWFQITADAHQGCQGRQKTRNFMRNSKIVIAWSTIQPKLIKIKNN